MKPWMWAALAGVAIIGVVIYMKDQHPVAPPTAAHKETTGQKVLSVISSAFGG